MFLSLFLGAGFKLGLLSAPYLFVNLGAECLFIFSGKGERRTEEQMKNKSLFSSFSNAGARHQLNQIGRDKQHFSF
jgi:hypothetical protein